MSNLFPSKVGKRSLRFRYPDGVVNKITLDMLFFALAVNYIILVVLVVGQVFGLILTESKYNVMAIVATFISLHNIWYLRVTYAVQWMIEKKRFVIPLASNGYRDEAEEKRRHFIDEAKSNNVVYHMERHASEAYLFDQTDYTKMRLVIP